MKYSKQLRTFLFLFLFCFIGGYGYAQNTELRANVYSGIFFFRGNGSATYSTVYYGGDLGYYNPMPYGRKSGFSYVFELQAQRVAKQKHLLGMGVSFEKLKSKAIIDSVYGDIGGRPAEGNVNIINDFITVSPYIGQRFSIKGITFDGTAGVDFAFSNNVVEEVKFKPGSHSDTYSRKNHPLDIRPRLQITASYKRVGLSTGYSVGTRSYYSYDNPNFINKKAYANFFRFGVSYKLK